MSIEEQAIWNADPPACAYITLAKVWTRKEALLKAVGVSLHHSMRDFSIGWHGNAACVEFPDIEDQLAIWTVHDVSPLPSGLVGALALRGHGIVRPLAFSSPIPLTSL